MSNELAKIASEVGLSQQIAQLTGQQQHITTSLDLQSVDGRKAMIACLQDCDARLTDQVNQIIDIANFMAHNVSIRDKKTGEYSEAVRLVIIDDKGTKYECASTGLIKSLGHLLFLFGEPPWKIPVRVKIRTKRNGERNIYWFEPVD